jgi:hypothetical protein
LKIGKRIDNMFGYFEEEAEVSKEAQSCLEKGGVLYLFFFLTVNAVCKLSLQISSGHLQTPND